MDHGTTTRGQRCATRLRARWRRFALRRADHVTTICEGLRGDIAARGIPAERITVIPNAVDTRSFASAPSPTRRCDAKLGLEGARCIGFAGSFYGYEGLHLLLEAAAHAAPRRPDLRVLLVGGGPQEAALKAQALGARIWAIASSSRAACRTTTCSATTS